MIRLMTYNIWMENILIGERMNIISQIIIKNNPDIICLQEITPKSFALLKIKLGKLYYFSKEGINKNYDTLTLSKHKILGIYNFPFRNSNMGRNLRQIDVMINNKKISIFNIHLESNYRDNKIKNQQLKTTFERAISCPNSFFIMGDTNIIGEVDLPKQLRDAWVDSGSDEKLRYTYDYLNNSHIHYKYRSRLDRIYLNRDWKIKNIELIGNREEDKIDGIYFPSDHFGIMIDVE